jgi:hypothetical protein
MILFTLMSSGVLEGNLKRLMTPAGMLVPLTIVVILLALWPSKFDNAAPPTCEANGACYVTPAGGGLSNGIDWSNAYAGLPTSWSPTNCGVTYYVAGGTYDYTSTSNTISSVCSSGSPLIILKATAANSGSVAGYVSSYGTSQAIFTQTTNADPEQHANPFFALTGTYITIDGVVPTSGTPSKTATFGIVLRSANDIILGFVKLTGAGANDQVLHVEYDGVQSRNQYGYQVTGCSRSSNVVTLTTNGNPPWVVGDNVDLWMNGATPTDFTTVFPSTGFTVTSISGNQIKYSQTGPDETCTGFPSPNPTTVTLNYGPPAGIIVDSTASSTNFTANDSYIHDIAIPVHFTANGCNAGCSFLRNYIARNLSTPTDHSEGFGGAVLNNSAIGQSILEDINGTSSISAVTCPGSCNWQNVAVYSNLSFCTIASQSAYIGPPTGSTWQTPQCHTSSLIADNSGVTNLLVYGNTFVRPPICIMAFNGNVASTATVTNNFMFCPGASVKITGSGVTHSYNTGWGGAINLAPTPGTGDYWTTTFPVAASTFVDATDATENFRLLSETVDAPATTGCTQGTNCLKDGLSLSAPYNIDLLGATRGADGTWERGAYESSGGAPVKPNPPTALNVTGVH